MFWRAAGNEERDIADGSAPSGAARIASRRRRLRSKNQLKLIQFRGFGRRGRHETDPTEARAHSPSAAFGRRMIRARYGGRELVLELSPGETLHERLSAELDIDPARLKLVCKGQNYSSVLPATATEQLVELCRGGAVVMVMGTPRSRQLDRPRTLREHAARIIAPLRGLSLAAVALGARERFAGLLSFFWLFVTSAFTKRRRPVRRDAIDAGRRNAP